MKVYHKISIIFLLFMLFVGVSIPLVHAQAIQNTILNATLAYQDPDPVEPGNFVELKFNVKNTGGDIAKNVELKIVPNYPFSLYDSIDTTSAVGDIKVYDASQTDTNEIAFKTRLVVDANAVEGVYDLQVQYRATGGSSAGIWQNLDPIKVKVQTTKTQLFVTDAHTEPERMEPGSVVTLSLTIKNLGANTIQDIKLVLDLDNATYFAPYQASNEKLLTSIPPKEEQTLSFPIISFADAPLKPHKVPLTITYQDLSGKKYEKKLYVSIIIDTAPEFVLNLEDRDVYQKGQRGKVVVSLSNIGASDINYVTLNLQQSENYESLSTSTVYVGNLESDDYETAQFDLYIKEYQPELPLYFKLYYKDNFNKDYQEDMVLPLKLFTVREAAMYGLSKKKNNLLVVMVITIIVLGSIFYYVNYRKDKHKLNA